MVKRPSFFYGWALVATAACTMMLAYGIRNNFGVFFPPILAEFGWDRADTAFIFSLNLVVYGVLGPFVGALADRWEPRKVALIGLVIFILAIAGCAFAQELWHFYILFGILAAVGASFFGWAILAPAIIHWFTKRRGMALGLGMVGVGLGFVLGMFIQWVISQAGWRNAYLVMAGLLVVIVLPMNRLFFYYRPEQRGMKPYSADETTVTHNPIPEHNVSHDWTVGEALKTRQLWFIILSQMLYWGLGCYMLLAHQIKFAQDVGYSSMFATSVSAVYGIVMVVGQLCGFISDRIGREHTVALASLITIAGLIALLSVKDTSQPWLLYFYAAALGLGAGMNTPATFAGAADMFHGKHYGAIGGLLITGMGMGGIIGPWLGGFIYDVTGSYRLAFLLCIGFFTGAGVLFWLAAPSKAAALEAKRLVAAFDRPGVASKPSVVKHEIK